MEKKSYIKPELNLHVIQLTEMLALSMDERAADKDFDVLVRQNQDWDVWGEEDKKKREEEDGYYYDEYADEYYEY